MIAIHRFEQGRPKGNDRFGQVARTHLRNMGLVDTRKEVLRLYRVILRTSRGFQWKNENGEPW